MGPQKRDFGWAAGLVLALVVYLVTFAYGYGQLSAKVDGLGDRLQRVERALEVKQAAR